MLILLGFLELMVVVNELLAQVVIDSMQTSSFINLNGWVARSKDRAPRPEACLQSLSLHPMAKQLLQQ